MLLSEQNRSSVQSQVSDVVREVVSAYDGVSDTRMLVQTIDVLISSGLLREQSSSSALDEILEIYQRSDDGKSGKLNHDDPVDTKAALSNAIVQYYADESDRIISEQSDQRVDLTGSCSLLIALITGTQHNTSHERITAIASFLCRKWLASNGPLVDVHNTSPFYAYQILARTMMRYLAYQDNVQQSHASESSTHSEIVLLLFQCLTRVLSAQNDDGSWGQSEPREETAYAVLALDHLSALPLTSYLDGYQTALDRGRQRLAQMPPAEPDAVLWTTKTQATAALSKAYVLSALHTQKVNPVFAARTFELCNVNQKELTKISMFMGQLPLLSSNPNSLIVGSWIEARLFLPRLEQLRDMVFHRQGMTSDKYFSWIPFTWTVTNNLNGSHLSSDWLFDMMTVSFLNYQADEYMEAVVGVKAATDLDKVKQLIIKSTESESQRSSPQVNGFNGDDKFNGHDSQTDSYPTEGVEHLVRPDTPTESDHLEPILKTLKDFIGYIMHHPHIVGASTADHKRLGEALRHFLLAHVQQILDNAKLSAVTTDAHSTASGDAPAPVLVEDAPYSSFKAWVRSVSADHTSCPYSFIFASCLLAKDGKDFFSSLAGNYIADDLCRHLATMCRMYNDLGSVSRDVNEHNLNSLNFPEFAGAIAHPNLPEHPVEEDVKIAKAKLKDLADYERRATKFSFAELESMDGQNARCVEMLRVFVDVTDLFGQIYVVKDIASQRTN